MAAQSPHLGADYDLPRADLAFRDGVPFAAAFDDGYYNADDGLAESRHVFLDGNGLSARMRESRHLTIAETGFGTGLNLLAVMAEMNRHPELRLDYISFEGFPLTAEQMEQAHASFTAVAAEAAALRAALPPRWPGYHLVQLCGGRLTLHLHYGEIGDMLPSLDFRADCWFLDGFAPARNPSMWTAENMFHVGRLTRPGGSLASFTAAGDVRRSLEAAGFAVERVPGYGRKRQMIRGRRSGDRDDQPMPPSRIAVIGGGIAGAAAAAGLRRRGAEVVLLETGTGIGEGASGNRMALQSPRLTVDHNAMSRLSAACLSFAARLSDLSGATMAKGVLALDAPERMAARHHVFRGQAWPVDLLRAAGPEDLPASVDESGSAIVYPFGRVIRPDMLLPCLMGNTQLVSGFEVASIDAGEDGLLIAAKDGRQRQADAVVLASGADLGQMMALSGDLLPLEQSYGQVSHVPVAATSLSHELSNGVSFGGYLTPALDGLRDLGATFTKQQQDVRTGHEHNLGLLPETWQSWMASPSQEAFGSRVRRRASLPDRRPVAGKLAEGIWVLGGLGARGFTLAPLLGETLAAEMLGHAAPMDRAQRAGILPDRYKDR